RRLNRLSISEVGIDSDRAIETPSSVPSVSIQAISASVPMLAPRPDDAPMWMNPPGGNEPRPGPSAVPAAVTSSMPVYEFLGLLVLAVSAALGESLDDRC